MIPLKGRWVFLSGETEFCVVDNVCVGVFCRGGFWSPHAALRARLVGVIGPHRTRSRKIRVGDSLLFARNGEVFYTPPIETIHPPSAARSRSKSTQRSAVSFSSGERARTETLSLGTKSPGD